MKIFYTLLFLFNFGYADISNSKDFLQREVVKPPLMERIIVTCYGGAIHELALFLGEDAIIAHPGADRFPFFEKLFPKLSKIQSVGTFNDVNLETLLRVKPDIVFAGVTSLTTNERIEALGIPVFTMGIGKHTYDSLLEEFRQVGKFLNKEDRANSLLKFWDDTILALAQTFPPKENRLKVLYANGTNQVSSESKGWWGDSFILNAGGVNIAQDIRYIGDISAELLLELDPDILIMSKNMSYQKSPESLKINPMYKNLRAVKNNNVYVIPVGGFWWDRPSPESILGIVWLSKILYPEETKEINLFKLTQTFFKEFYNYNLTKDEYKTFFYSQKELR